jgi:uncharacterized ubiquitin-like protein YukD
MIVAWERCPSCKAPMVGTKPIVEFIDVIDFKLSIKASLENRHGYFIKIDCKHNILVNNCINFVILHGF